MEVLPHPRLPPLFPPAGGLPASLAPGGTEAGQAGQVPEAAGEGQGGQAAACSAQGVAGALPSRCRGQAHEGQGEVTRVARSR